MVHNCKTLDELWGFVYKLNKDYFPENKLMPILGNGQTRKPRFMFVFINPTVRNISSSPDWQGPRFPFIGTKQVWRIFHKAGLFDDELLHKINDSPYWSLEFTDQVLSFLKSKSFYFTNIVKWTGHDSTLPNSDKIKIFLPILKREIEIVQPEYIVTFGLIPFESLTGKRIKLSEYYSEFIRAKNLKTYETEINSFNAKIIPCYFPIGRGEPKKAVEILKSIKYIGSETISEIVS